ncbi:MAG: acyl-CoA dehydrogenase family protein [Ilumatobacteraceae bacterium]
MTITHDTMTVDTVLRAIRQLAPSIFDRATEIETARRVPTDMLDSLRAAGCFRLVRPATYGGLEASLPDAMRAFESLARADASVAWTVMIGAGSWIDLAHLPRETFDALYATNPDAITAGVFNPSGSIAAVDGGYEVSGRWSFASGCQHADVLFGNAIEGVVDGMPQLRGAIFAPADIVIEDTWSVSGLCGTGSHHFHVDGAVVAAERTYAPMDGEPCVDAPIVHLPPPAVFSQVIASVALGIAQGALDDITVLSAQKVPLLSPTTLQADPLFQFELASADTDVRAARSLLYDEAERLWASATSGDPLTMEHRAHVRASAVWTIERATSVVTTAYRAGGGTSVYSVCPLQRRLRDIHALAQHFVVRRDTLITAGAILAGHDVQPMVF